MTAIPTTYKDAGKIGTAGRSALACARLVWDGLSKTMRRWLSEASPSFGMRRGVTPTTTLQALIDRGLVDRRARLTPLGLLVRECGIRTRTGAPRG